MTQPTVDPLNCHRFILADIVPPNRQERVVRRIVVCTVQLQGFSRSSNRFSVAASRLPHSQSMRQSDQKPTRSTVCSFFEGNARARPIPSQPRSRPAPVEGAPRALPHELGSNSGSTGVETPSCLAMAFIDRPKVYNNTAVSFFVPVHLPQNSHYCIEIACFFGF